ncbi:MAG TPA: UbiX family flavin prenyltransferase [Chitinophagales bacterium]|nr:UbiX family flavin prenyltransferase [Chitinophagales bacterium]
MGRKIVIAITGASGSIYAKCLIDSLLEIPEQWESIGLLMSKNARQVWETELGNKDYENIPFTLFEKYDFNAPFASGSADYDTMIVIPCSMGTLGRIAQGISDDLLTRAADVILKERRKLILVTRETPLNQIHIQNMLTITQCGGVICPASPSFYSQPTTMDEMAKTVSDRVVNLAGLSIKSYKWGE